MLRRPWGIDWTYTYFPPSHDGDKVFAPLASQTPTIYVFDRKPTDDQAINNTGSLALQTIATWAEKSNPTRREITITAINDPRDGSEEKQYWIAINYLLKTSGQKQLDLKTFYLSRPDGQYSDATPTALDLRGQIPLPFYTDAEIDKVIANAEIYVQSLLGNKGFKWHRIENHEALKLTVSYRAIADCFASQIQDSGDQFNVKFDQFQDRFNSQIQAMKLEYDANQDRDIDSTEEKSKVNQLFFVR